jgi:simple sugar transport system ATP-binding protein
MFDKEIKIGERTTACRLESLLRLENIGIEDYRLRLRNINLTLNRGEVIGLAGMEGSGQKLFLQMLAGIKRPVCGKILINDENFAGKRYESFLKAGISYIPASRMEEGLIPGLTLTEHFILSEEHNELMISHREALSLTQSRISDFRIKGAPYSKVEQLSGGNQQRALLALMREKLNLILMEHPTRGLDIESSIWIWKKMKERCADCTSIVFISADLEEIIQYSDRILVFFGGMVSEPIDARSTSVDELGQLIGGIGWQGSEN